MLTHWNYLTNQEMEQYNEFYCYGMQIREMDHPYMMSPPALPVAGATSTAADTVKVIGIPWDYVLTSRIDGSGDHA